VVTCTFFQTDPPSAAKSAPPTIKNRFIHIWARRGGTWKLIGDQFINIGPVVKHMAIRPTPGSLAACEGTYSPSQGNVVSVTVRATEVGLRVNFVGGNNQTITMLPMSDATYFNPARDAELTFVRDA